MSKGQRIRERTAREKIAAQQAAARKAERQRVLLIGGGSVALVLVLVAVIVIVALNRHSPKQGGQAGLPTNVATELTHVPASVLAAVGNGGLPAASLPIRAITDTALTAGGKPEMLYIGAEFCPYCAAERWAMAVALSRFGAFGTLTGIHSSATDRAGPNTATLTFLHQAYTSPYLTFTPVEHQTVQGGALQPVTRAENALWVKYDTTQTSQGPTQGYPFIDFGNKVILTGPTYNPLLLHGLSWQQIAGQLNQPSSAVARNIDGSANYITAAICKMTGNKPGSVCTAGPIPAIEANL
jgi:hypothetical protein